ncbi:MAG: hypothetical protein U0744_18015 [Gemmataceae bacterium]
MSGIRWKPRGNTYRADGAEMLLSRGNIASRMPMDARSISSWASQKEEDDFVEGWNKEVFDATAREHPRCLLRSSSTWTP